MIDIFKIVDLNGFTRDELDTYEQYKHIFLGNDRVVTKLRDDSMTESVTFFYHKDHLGSSSLMTDTSGAEHTYDEYYPYGSQWINSNKQDLSDPASGVKHYFTGHEYDKETQLYYMLARYYDPELGGFLSGDPDLQGLDGYQYVARNPLTFIDDDGKKLQVFAQSQSSIDKIIQMMKIGTGGLYDIKVDKKGFFSFTRNERTGPLSKSQKIFAEYMDKIINQTDIVVDIVAKAHGDFENRDILTGRFITDYLDQKRGYIDVDDMWAFYVR